MKLEKLDFVIRLSLASGLIFLIFFVIYRENYLFYPCITLLAITIISFFANVIMQKIQKRKEISKQA